MKNRLDAHVCSRCLNSHAKVPWMNSNIFLEVFAIFIKYFSLHTTLTKIQFFFQNKNFEFFKISHKTLNYLKIINRIMKFNKKEEISLVLCEISISVVQIFIYFTRGFLKPIQSKNQLSLLFIFWSFSHFKFVFILTIIQWRISVANRNACIRTRITIPFYIKKDSCIRLHGACKKEWQSVLLFNLAIIYIQVAF